MADQHEVSSDKGLLRHIRLRSATALVVANIIGAGIFTTTGFQASDLGHPGYIFALWVVGGVLAFCGALCYAELGAAMPRAGAEYVYLSETYGGMLGFMSAFVSLIAGFSAPIASAAKGLIVYLSHFFPFLAREELLFGRIAVGDVAAIILIWALIAIHTRPSRESIGFNDAITWFKVGGITLIILAAASIGSGDAGNFTDVSEVYGGLGAGDKLGAFATSLIFVMFCYQGYNAAAYVTSEVKDPQRNLPLSLLAGTGIVVVLYLGLNAVYFYGAPASELAGKPDVGLVAARGLFGDRGVGFVTFVLCVSILASASAMTIAGPRVYYALGRDFALFAFLSKTHGKSGTPVTALVVQGVVTSVIIVLGAIDEIQQYAGFTLTLFSALAVSCVIVLRIRRPEMERPFRTWGYPVTPALFLALSAWMMFWALQSSRRTESLWGLATVAAGGIIFLVCKIVFGSAKSGTSR